MWKLLSSAIVVTVVLVSVASGASDWWENGNFYQIYPRSFQDSDGDGVGDLNGVTEHLQYLKEIGMDGVWMSPIFQSPMADFGYDISDYYQIQPEYGSIDDLDRLIARAVQLGLHIILDFVPNHTSDEHEWFQLSVAGDPDYADFYIWHPGKVNATTGEREPPSNWVSVFRGSAWQWVEQRQEYYLHQFSVKQPDLNFRNPAVRKALLDVMIYWLNRGVAGFRIDALPYLLEVEIDPATGTYPDEPVIDASKCPDPESTCHLDHIYTKSRDENLELVYDWRALLDDYTREHGGETRIILTEAYTDFQQLMHIYGDGVHNGSQVPFNFEFFTHINNRSTADDYNIQVNLWLNSMPQGVYANWVLGNHDNPRIATRFGEQRIDLLNILLQTLPGIAVTYYGEEYGMKDVFVSWEDTVDVVACNTNPEIYQSYSRDPARSPFRWNSSTNAGFSTAERTWLPVGEGYTTDNVAVQLAADNSHLQIFIRLTQLRKNEPSLSIGNFESLVVEDVLLYRRQSADGDPFVIVLNIGDTDSVINFDQLYDGIASDTQLEVATSSLQSGLRDGQVLSALEFVAKAYNGYVLRVLSP